MLCGIPLQTHSVKGLQTKSLWFMGKKKKIITLNTGTTVLPPTSPSGAQDLVPAMAHTGVPKGGETGEGMMHKPTDTQAGTCRPAARPETAE